MDALIFCRPGSFGVRRFNIAGRPLIVRQLQWLRALGVERVAIEVGLTGDEEFTEWFAAGDPAFVDVVAMPTLIPLGDRKSTRLNSSH